MEAYRTAVLDEKLGAELMEILAALEKGGKYSINGEQYKRVPAGYDENHPRADLLKYKGLYAHPAPFGVDLVTSPELVGETMKRFQVMALLQQWLVRAGI